MAEKVKLHRCGIPIKVMHPCWNVQKALDQQGVEYEVVKEALSRGKREWVIEQTGQKYIPVIEFADGSTYREESKGMVERIKSGGLFESGPSSPQ